MSKTLKMTACALIATVLCGCSVGNVKTISCSGDLKEDAYTMGRTYKIKYKNDSKELTSLVEGVSIKFNNDSDEVKENFDKFVEMQEENFKKYEDEYKGVKIDFQVDKKKYTMKATVTVDVKNADEDTFEMTELQEYIDEDKIFDLDAFWEDYEELEGNEDSLVCHKK